MAVRGSFTNSWEKKRCRGERETYTQLNAQFQRTKRDKKALSEQCKETEENNRLEKTRNLFKKTGDIKGTFYERTGKIKDRMGKDLTEAHEIKKWQNTQNYFKKKKGLNDPDNHDGLVTRLKPDILECKVKWALESTTTNKA